MSEPETIYRVDEHGNRVAPDTCPCRGCILERDMRVLLAFVDGKYKPTPDQQRHYGPREREAHCARWAAEREAVVQMYVRVGWFGCLMPIVIPAR